MNHPSAHTSVARPVDAGPARLPVIHAVTGHGLFESLRQIAPEFSGRARVELLHDAFESALVTLKQSVDQGRCDVVVASGSNGAYLRARLPVPVVQVQVGGYDLMAALATARELSPRIAVVLHHEVSAALRRFMRGFNVDVELRTYETREDVVRCVGELADRGVDVVVGAGMVADHVRKAGLTAVLLYSLDSVRAAMETALAIAEAQHRERARRDHFDLVLRHLNDGVVAVDMQGRITTLNPAAARIIGVAGHPGHALAGPALAATGVSKAASAPGRLLAEVAPGLTPRAVLEQGRSELGRVEDVRGQSLVIDAVPMYEAGVQTGAVLTLHPSQPLERAVGRLRAHSHRRSRSARYTLDGLVAASEPMRELVHRCEVLARASDASVLIQGESGSGKEVVAQGIHRASRRHARPFVAINCGAFPEQLLESELFGYEEGAFTGARRQGKAGLFEAADGGTLLLDEVGEMPLPLQTRLLRALQEKEVTRVGGIDAIPIDVRIIAATHRDLAAMARQGSFRHDLFYRLHILQVRVPPLRERPEDIAALAAELLPAALARLGAGELAAPALRAVLPLLAAHDWPGNVRELENVIERMALECLLAGEVPAVSVLRDVVDPAGGMTGRGEIAATEEGASLEAMQRAAEIRHIREVMHAHGGNQASAARALGISRTTLWRKLRVGER
ncbi:propionate catabolism operon regulatory protein PrpR [Achromobacter aloeverae]|uniref:Propionate catabolism operon regulatory protein PrpR n=1 Tax=Achromobacter aloeverae TaxID=1750518 RepID=A0A4Q1HRA3_9BURK|nr:propionate catabolism operon regulatory protein PrpR [Achromobacter aloeverae]RXN92595.1 propionate catabolism operon regulatory protein PrpR [Achromobacter aloeverae]